MTAVKMKIALPPSWMSGGKQERLAPATSGTRAPPLASVQHGIPRPETSQPEFSPDVQPFSGLKSIWTEGLGSGFSECRSIYRRETTRIRQHFHDCVKGVACPLCVESARKRRLQSLGLSFRVFPLRSREKPHGGASQLPPELCKIVEYIHQSDKIKN